MQFVIDWDSEWTRFKNSHQKRIDDCTRYVPRSPCDLVTSLLKLHIIVHDLREFHDIVEGVAAEEAWSPANFFR
jgi:hypothetical protein